MKNENEKIVTRFKDEKKLGCLVAIRAAESLDRRIVLKQGDYRTGRYGTQYDCEVVSPFMDLPTEDLWKINSLVGLEINEIYSKMWDAGVPLATQRIGSPLNVHAGDAVKLYKALNPTTYGKMVGRLDTVDFTASYGGVFNNGFKYIKLDQPRPFLYGIVTDPFLIEALNYIDIDYRVKPLSGDINSEEAKKVYNTATRKISEGENIILCKVQEKFIREQAAIKARENGNLELEKKFIDSIPCKKTWYDYTKQLIEGAEPMYQKSWRPKMKTSIKHWAHTGSCVNESTIMAYRICSGRKDTSFGNENDTYQEFVDWAVAGYTDITRKPVLKTFRYNQDCAENVASSYIYNMIERWFNGGREEFENNKYLYNIVFNGVKDNMIKGVLDEPAINFSSYVRAKELHEALVGGFKYSGPLWNTESSTTNAFVIYDKKDFKGFPKLVKTADGNIEMDGEKYKVEENADGSKVFSKKLSFQECGAGRTYDELNDIEKHNRLMATLVNIAYNLLHDAVKDSSSFKRSTIMCLRNDLTGTYMCFGRSAEESELRKKAEVMFGENEKVRQEKIKKLEKIKESIDNEKATLSS